MPRQRREFKIYNENIDRTFTQHQTQITQLADSITLQASEINDLETNQATMVITSGGILTTVSGGDVADQIISTVNQTATSYTIDASKIDLAGYVTFTNLSSSGQTSINGANIQTGSVTAEKIDVTDLAAFGASIARFELTQEANHGTTAQGGHLYTNSLYSHSDDGANWEYELGLQRSDWYYNLAFYVGRIPYGGAWTDANHEDLFYVRNNGDLYAQDATVNTLRTTGTLKSNVSDYGLEDHVQCFKFDHMVFLQANYLCLEDLASFDFDMNALLGDSCAPLQTVFFDCDVYVPDVKEFTLHASSGSADDDNIISLETGTAWYFLGTSTYDQSAGQIYYDRFTTLVCQKAPIAALKNPTTWRYSTESCVRDGSITNQVKPGKVVIDTNGYIHLYVGNTELTETNLTQYDTFVSGCYDETALKQTGYQRLNFGATTSNRTSKVWHHESDELTAFTWQTTKVSGYSEVSIAGNPHPRNYETAMRNANTAFIRINMFWMTD